MKPAEYIDALRRDGARIIAASDVGLGRDVPSCSGWTIAELLWHVGNVHTFWRQVASGLVAGPDSYQEPARPGDQALVEWFVNSLEETVDALARIDPNTPAWTWGRRQDVGFIQRRVAHETAIHCWDAVGATGTAEPLEPGLAADGIAEFLEDVLPGMSRDLDGPTQLIALHANDIDERWHVRAGLGSCEVLPVGAVEATVSATASELVLLLWGRRRLDRVAVDGDREAVQRLLARASF